MSNVLTVHFTTGTGLAGKFVRLWTRSRFSHVSLSTPFHCVDAAPGRGVGFRKSPVKSETIQFELTDAQMDRLNLFIDQEMDSPYDWFGDLACGLPWFAREHKDKWFCSEFACACLQHIGIIRSSVDPWRLSPQGLYDFLDGHSQAITEIIHRG